MDFDGVALSVGKQFLTAMSAPVPFFAAVMFAGFIIWKIVQREYSNRLADAASKLELSAARVTDYERKLSGASPDEAKAQIELLEKRIDDLSPQINALAPRTFTAEQRETASRFAAPYRDGYLRIAADGSSHDAANLGRGIAAAFQGGGWRVDMVMMLGIGEPPQSGVAVMVWNPNSLAPVENVVTDALKWSGVEFNLRVREGRRPRDGEREPDVEVLITSRFSPVDWAPQI